ncbi:hypothetical protein ACGFNU_01950 [Spirillospora sp. NPDC048911]|uniref:hypothetical protein n=1 Tax=Spirillospora sp. NPDC048911 TaxID=3364527 RepID=UPI003711C246
MFQFNQPSSGAWLKPAEHSGHLLLILKVHEVGERFDQLKGRDVPVARFDFVDLDEADPAPRRHVSDSHPGIVNKLLAVAHSGGMVLGRCGQVATDKGNPAWVLGPYAEGTDDQRAATWLTANQPVAPAPAAAPPAPAAPAAAPVPQPAAAQSAAVAAPAGQAAAAPVTRLDPEALPAEVKALLAQLNG